MKDVHALHNERGFTLIELMATLAILALIVVIAVPAVGNIIENAEERSMLSDIEMAEKAAELASITGYEGQPETANLTGYQLDDLVDLGYLDMADDHPLYTKIPSVNFSRESRGIYQVDVDTLPAEYRTVYNANR